jgi:hypothetical protein
MSKPRRQEHTGLVKVAPQDQPGVTGRSWTLWLPCVLAFLWSVLVIVGANFVELMSCWSTCGRGMGGINAVARWHWVLAAVSVLVLVAGLRFPSWRRAAVITAWMIIPVGLGGILIWRLVGGS